MSLTLAEARARAALVSDVSYALDLDLTDRETFGCRATVSFACTEPGTSTFLELAHARDLLVDGIEPEYADGRISLRDLAATNEVVVEARLPYVTDGEGMHAFTDPADGELYVSAYVGIDIAQHVFPCFDQNDLKATFELRVTAPERWTVVGNGHEVSHDAGRWEFAATPPLPPALFVLCGGPWASVTWEHAGLPFGWHARASLAGPLERDAAELRRVTVACFDHYARIFDEPYPFDSYDQALVPGLNWGAMETAGCVTYRDEFLPLGEPTEPERRSRTMVIAHEMAHMWFGDLVTMTWWEDTWLQESFADYLGFRVSEDATGLEGAFVDFTIGWKPNAYLADERRSTHPVAPLPEDVPDVAAASTNFDSLSYAKGNSVLRQLVTWLGDEAFFAGVNAYLSRHRWGNATLDDFVTALDGATDRDVRSWVEAWLRTTGFDTIRVERHDRGFTLSREGSRPHRVRVALYDVGVTQASSTFVDLGDEPVRLENSAVAVPNAGGETFARVRLDRPSWDTVAESLSSIPDTDVRAVLWTTAFDMVWTGDLSADGFLDLVERHVPAESHVTMVQGVLAWAQNRLVPLFVPAEGTTAARARIAGACTAGLEAAPTAAKAVILTRALAATTADAALLRAWLADGMTGAGVRVDPALRWLAVFRLATLGALSVEEIERQRASDATIVGALGAARAGAAIPEAGAKARAWDRITDDATLSNREFEALAEGLWDVERPDLVRDQVDRYFADAAALAAARGPSFADQLGDAFPRVQLDAGQVSALEQALEGVLPTVLRRAWEDNLDDMRRSRRA